MGTLEEMEAVGLTGSNYPGATGLLNHPTTGDDAVTLTTQGAGLTFADLTDQQVYQLIAGRMSNVISVSKEALGRHINTGMTVYLPGTQYELAYPPVPRRQRGSDAHARAHGRQPVDALHQGFSHQHRAGRGARQPHRIPEPQPTG